jgi:molybdopterin adenylyltransferase
MTGAGHTPPLPAIVDRSGLLYYCPHSHRTTGGSYTVGKKTDREFIPVNIAVMTVSDTRTEANDTSGQALVERLTAAGHRLAEKVIAPDDIYRLREIVSRWIADPDVNVIITTGGTGMTGRDSTPEAIRPLLDKELEGIGELFRWLSYRDIKTSTVASRALGGVANATFIFCLPGSTGACRTGWDEIIEPQLDYRSRPCNMVELMPRLRER